MSALDSPAKPPVNRTSSATPHPRSAHAIEVLHIVDQLCNETRTGKTGARLDSSLERELGLDSLARVELLARVERSFDVRLPADTLARMETPADLLRALRAALAAAAPERIIAPEAEPQALEGAAAPDQAATLLDVLEWHVTAHADRPHILFYRTPGETEILTYGELWSAARAVAAGLVRDGLSRGQAVAIMLPTSLEFFHAFYGVLLAGGVPVPLYPPARLSQIEDHLRRQAGIIAGCLAPVLITVDEAKLLARLLKSQVDSLHSVKTVADLRTTAEPPALASGAGDTALIQYTSGSTGNPKGVVLTHANLLANIRAWSEATRLTSADVCVSWLPLYHDMGLIGAWLGSLYNACLLVLMSPLDFLARPESWLWAVHRHRGTVTAAPNFAFELCLRRLRDEDLAGLDLSSWRMAANGAEPVSPDTVERFCERFARYGLRREAMTPVYGLAECSVGLAVPPMGRGPRIDRVARTPLVRSGRAEPAAPGDAQALRFVGCGRALPGHEMRIVDEADRELPERTVGHLQFRGPSATSGYFRNPDETRRLFHGPWLDTGDIAYLADGEVFITSRAKDMIIRGGHNIYPYELEEAIGNLPGVRKGCVAIFGARDLAAGTERLVAVVETRERDDEPRVRLRRLINDLAVDLLGVPLDDIVLAPAHSVLKTSSGKIRRAATRELYESGRLGARGRSVALQVARLVATGAAAQLRRGAARLGAWLYGAYAWILFAAFAPAVWLSVAALRRPAWGWAVARAGVRAFLRLAALPVRVEGRENLPRATPFVAVANHASYLDGLTLVAALPRPMAFVAKRELAQGLIPATFLRGLGAEFVERFDVQRSAQDAQRLADRARAGAPLLFFAEGTFTRAPGLRPFHMGAFLAAAQGTLPVVPLAIRGTRAIFPDESRMPRRGSVTITIGSPIMPAGSDWNAALAVRDAARAHILRHCGESDLAETVGR
ncbi:MAG: AMP-binding protein [Pseudomonadota bacterium]